MRRTAWMTIALAAFGLATWAALAAAAGDAFDTEAAARGKVTFRVYCGNCHGAQAEGDGELAKLLTVEPADLTRIAERYDGTFPADWIARKIDGRERVRGHGNQEMPVWGLNFRDRSRSEDQEPIIEAKIADLVAFLQSLQKEPVAAGGQR